MDDGDVDACRAQLVGEGLGQRRDGDVADGPGWRARAARGQAADIDDPAPALSGHVGRGGPGAAQVAKDLGVKGGEQVGVGQVGQGPGGAGAGRLGGVVDQDVDAAQLVGRAADSGAHRRVVGGVGGQREDPAAVRRRQLLACCLQPDLVAGQQGDVRALPGQRAGDGESDAPAPPGDQRPLAGQLQVHAGGSEVRVLGLVGDQDPLQ